MAQTRGQGDVKPNEEMIRHMVMNSLRGFNQKFKNKYGNMVLCSDAGNTWRRDIFPQYKYKRKKDRTESSFDWDNIFDILTRIKNELKENFPYVMMYEEKCEADDIIAILTKYYYQHEKIMIVSGDKDFSQLQRYKNVSQYSPITKKFIKVGDPLSYLFEHVIRGDAGDGVPNILSNDDTFVVGTRQKPLTKRRVNAMIEDMVRGVTPFDGEIKRNYLRNIHLIDLSRIPEDIRNQVIDIYSNYQRNDRSMILGYFIKSRLKNLMTDIQEF